MEGKAALWVASEGNLYAIVESDDGLELWTERTELQLTGLSADAAGHLWGVADGKVHHRKPDGSWHWWHFDAAIKSVEASSNTPEAWFILEGSVWRHLENQFRPVMPDSGFSAAQSDGVGGLLGVAKGDILRVVPGEEPEIPTITFDEDIKPLSDEKCGPCHGPKGQGGQALHLHEHWSERIDDVLYMVINKNMPLDPYPKLVPAEIALIQAWQVQGLLESAP
jgi:hypothetical protein